ncbi:MAG: 3-deoxy-7-phosphoheptulonate synthase [Verrucomicrobiales bacterium]|jgi:3-deoxy-7-phosphoheptulonate synthase
MSIQTDDVNIAGLRQLIAPVILMDQLKTTDATAKLVFDSRQLAAKILRGEDDRLLCIVGPCSIHDPKAALDYAAKLKSYADGVKDDLAIIMRVYFEKPRTTVGWKGLINDPHLNQTFDINEGLKIARQLLVDLAELGMPAGTEFLDTISPQYVADLVAWGAIGARTTESQIHRELASGLSAPVGFKNGTSGNFQIALDAIGAAAGSHHFLSVTKAGDTAIVQTKGNDDCHVILRGGSRVGTNFDAASAAEVVDKLKATGLPPHVMIDCSHANSGKKFENQPGVASDLAQQIAGGSKAVVATMIESNLKEGAQSLGDGDLSKLEYGMSVTDQCVSWETTVTMLDELAEAVRTRRSKNA